MRSDFEKAFMLRQYIGAVQKKAIRDLLLNERNSFGWAQADRYPLDLDGSGLLARNARQLRFSREVRRNR